jgi:hypothetical protein
VVEVVMVVIEKPKFTVGGVEVLLSKEDVEQKLETVEPENIREVSVEVNGKRYPVKQALAEATGLLRGNFTSHDAMRVFRKLSLPMGTGPTDVSTYPERFFTAIKSLNEFDQKEVRGVIGGLVARTDRDNCFAGIYYRSKANVESLLSLKSVRDVQAITMLTRSLFELAVDIRLIDVIPDAVRKIKTFSEVELLRAAKKVVSFKAANPTASVNSSIQAEFIKNNGSRIDAEKSVVWPGASKVSHWSQLDLRSRAQLLKAPFEEIYEVRYPELSWYTHAAGLTGFNLKSETFLMLAGCQFALAGRCYAILLTAIIDEFHLAKADARIKGHMKYANIVPFTDTVEQEDALKRELLG